MEGAVAEFLKNEVEVIGPASIDTILYCKRNNRYVVATGVSPEQVEAKKSDPAGLFVGEIEQHSRAIEGAVHRLMEEDKSAEEREAEAAPERERLGGRFYGYRASLNYVEHSGGGDWIACVTKSFGTISDNLSISSFGHSAKDAVDRCIDTGLSTGLLLEPEDAF